MFLPVTNGSMQGEVSFLGKPVRGPASDRLVVFQESALFPWMTTYQNVIYGPVVTRNRSSVEIEADAIQLLEQVGLREFKDKYPSQLSGGMQRRAELARAMINNPKIMMLDEPFRGLDAMTRDLMQVYLLSPLRGSQAVGSVRHFRDREAILLADRLLIMTNRPGRIKHIMSIDLPGPRTSAVLTSVQYLQYKQEALEVLHSEAVKAFAGGSKAAADSLKLMPPKAGRRR